MFSRLLENPAGRSAGLLLSICVLLSCRLTVPVSVQAQPDTARYSLDDLARAKAEMFDRVQAKATEPTPNQASYDVLHYLLDLHIDPSAEILTGTVTMSAVVVSGPLGDADLDLHSDLTVDSVRCAGVPVGHAHGPEILTVLLDRVYETGEIFVVEVAYHGTPSVEEGSFVFDTYGGSPMIWSLSEPFGARTWYPCKDYPEDKADSADIWVTVPDGLIVASNGTLRETTADGGWVTYRWHESYPITTYLISVAVHPYTVFSDYYRASGDDSMEIRYYVFEDHYDLVQEDYARVPAMITIYADLFGEYPFIEEKYGHAEFTWGGGMEHQTITSLGGYSEHLIVHELAHMWWGDMITCDTFNHIWLNEGFATYCEALYAEHAYDWDAYKYEMETARYFGDGTVYVPDLSDGSRIFDGNLSYRKASWVLHMLRGVVGDSTFFDILRSYHAGPGQYGTATTEDFQDICEVVSGRDFDHFFQQWIYGEGYPYYAYNWDYQPVKQGYEIALTIEQLQTRTIFHMPIQISIATVAGETTLVVADSLAVQQFTLVVSDEPVSVELDKEEWILRMVAEEIADASFDRGILLVNAVTWGMGAEITSAYDDSVFWGTLPISFWDCYGEPAGGYPSTLPSPIGHGAVPLDTLKHFSSVVWVSNVGYVDLWAWLDTPVLSYLWAGGNVLLVSRWGQYYVYDALRAYLGIEWAEGFGNKTPLATSVYPGLIDMPELGIQSTNAVFDTSLVGGESSVLFLQLDVFDEPRGMGAWRRPPEGGTQREDGAQFVFISGRPYRYEHDSMRANMEFILRDFFGEPYGSMFVADACGMVGGVVLFQNTPNPFNPATAITFEIPRAMPVLLAVYDVQGRRVATLVDRPLDAGKHVTLWDGMDRKGHDVASGVYWYRLEVEGETLARKMILLR